MKEPSFVVEHLDEELFPWSKQEYRSIIKYMSPFQVIFSRSSFDIPEDWETLKNFQVLETSIVEHGIPVENTCLLDSEAPETLSPEDGEVFSHFLFGGILGNTDEFDFDRTSVLRSMGFPRRNLGSVQMTTDTAVKVTKQIVVFKKKFESLNFVDRPEIQSGEHEKLILNFRFLADENGAPLIAEGIREILLDNNDFDVDLLE